MASQKSNNNNNNNTASKSPPRTSSAVVVSGSLQSHAVRIPPHSDLVPSLLDAAKQAMDASNAESAFIMTSVGSLSEVTLRMAATDNDNDNSQINSEGAGTTTDNTNPPHKKKQKVSTEQEQEQEQQKSSSSSSLAEATSLQIRTFSQHFEIVSLIGTFSAAESGGGKHLHMSISNSAGEVFGGHLMSGKVFTTLELVLGTCPGISFTREMDPQTGYKELVVKKSSSSSSTTTTSAATTAD